MNRRPKLQTGEPAEFIIPPEGHKCPRWLDEKGGALRNEGRLRENRELKHLGFEEVRTDFEFLLNSNFYLHLSRR